MNELLQCLVHFGHFLLSLLLQFSHFVYESLSLLFIRSLKYNNYYIDSQINHVAEIHCINIMQSHKYCCKVT
jgi:hypothetical protein